MIRSHSLLNTKCLSLQTIYTTISSFGPLGRQLFNVSFFRLFLYIHALHSLSVSLQFLSSSQYPPSFLTSRTQNLHKYSVHKHTVSGMFQCRWLSFWLVFHIVGWRSLLLGWRHLTIHVNEQLLCFCCPTLEKPECVAQFHFAFLSISEEPGTSFFLRKMLTLFLEGANQKPERIPES